MKFLNLKRADGGVIAILIVVIILVFIGWLVNVGNRECRTNRDCGSDAYCGSDFACHQIPVIEKSPVVVERHYAIPALIIGIAMIITAVILRWDKLKKPKREETEEASINNYSASRLRAP
jgi:dolichyl-phosphate-mannose--protein O-mannosyl transferase